MHPSETDKQVSDDKLGRTTTGSWLMSLGSTAGTTRKCGTSVASRPPTLACILQIRG